MPLNAAATGPASRPATVHIVKGSAADVLTQARDVLLWVEYDVV